MKFKFYITIGFLFILAGALLGSDYIIHFIRNTNLQPIIQPKLVNSMVDDQSEVKSQNVFLPTHINVPSVELSVDIEPGYYDYSNNTWSLSDTRASFATVTSVPNANSGNTYIYGHNQANLFAKLNKISIGDEAMVVNSNGETFLYKLVRMTDILPDDISFLNSNSKPTLTLQTCSGLWNQYRRLYFFDFEGNK